MSADLQKSARIPALDLVRSLALVGMVIYHSVYDLMLFGFLPAGMATSGFWSGFARTVAGSFIVIAGVSLYLAHRHGIRWRSFLRRLGVLVCAAMAVSLATYLIEPGWFVYYGILHSIAVSSLVGLAFLRLPATVTLAAAVLAFVLPAHLGGGIFEHPALVWLGLASQHPPSMDFEPFFPWIAPFLAGLAGAKLADRAGLWVALAGRWADQRGLARLAWPGRHSLAIYLIHQPLLFGSVAALSWLLAH